MTAGNPNPGPPSSEELFFQARVLTSEEEQAAFLQRACGDDIALRSRVEALLKADRNAAGFMDTHSKAVRETEEFARAERPGQLIGRYKLLQLIGEGGFGAVFMAEQEEPIRRRIALKIIKPGMDSRMVAARFEAERQALALMDHPHIARVYDGGITDQAMGARPYFVMEYVIGDPISRFADARKLSIESRLELFTQVCEAVQHAHTKGIIHRDLKPSNVLVSLVDGRPFAKVIDFGIAKSLASRLTEKTLFTEHRQLIGTPEYMSPEQAEGSPDIDTRADVYALGVLLYELLTGTTPFDGKRLRSAAFAEMQRIIREEDPMVPSVRLSRSQDVLAATAALRQAEPARLSMLIRGELDWIVMKALEKDRGRRYETPNQLAADVRRHLTGEAVIAAPPSAGYRLRKFVRRHKGPVLTGGVVAAALIAGIAGTTWQAYQADRQRRLTDAANAKLQREWQIAGEALNTIVQEGTDGDMTIGAVSGPGELGHERAVQTISDVAIGQMRRAKKANAELEAQIKSASSQLAIVAAEAEKLGLPGMDGQKYEVPNHGTIQIKAIKSSGDPPHFELVAADDKGDIAPGALPLLILADMAKNAMLELAAANSSLMVERDAAEWSAFAANLAMAQLAIESRDWPEARFRLDACPEKFRNWVWGFLNTTLNDAALILHGHKTRADLAVFSPDGARVLSMGSSLEDDGTARVWDAVTGRMLCTVQSTRNHFSSVGFVPDGNSFYTLTQPRSWIGNESFPPILQRWDASSGKLLSQFSFEDLVADDRHTRGRVALSPDGSKLLWSRTGDWRTAIVDLDSSGTATWLTIPGWFRSSAPFSPDGQLICTVTGDDDTGETVRVWEVATGKARFETPQNPPNKQGRNVLFTAFSPDAHSLLTNHWSGGTSVWDLSAGRQRQSLFVPEEDGETRGASSWQIDNYKFSAAITRDGRLVASMLDDEQGVRVWEFASGHEIWQKRLNVQIVRVAFSPSVSILAVADSEDAVWLLDAETGTTLATLTGQSFGGRSLNGNDSPFSPDGTRLVTRARNGDVCLWSLPLTPGRTEFASPGETIYRSTFIPATSKVVASFSDQSLRVFDARTGRSVRTLPMDDDADKSVYYATATRDGARLATSSWKAVVRVWNLNDGAAIASRDFSKDAREGERRVEVHGLRFLGTHLLVFQSFYPAVGDSDDSPPVRQAVIDWDPDTGNTTSQFSEYAECGRGISISPTEDRIVFGAFNGTRSLVDAHTGNLIAKLEDWAASGWAPPAAFSADGAALAGIVRGNDLRERIQIWRASDGNPGPVVTLEEATGPVQAIKFSPDGKQISVVTWIADQAEGGRVVLIDAATGSVLWSAVNRGRSMDNFDFSPDGSVIVTSRRMDQSSTDVWNTANGSKVLTLHYGLGFYWSHMDEKDRSCFSDDGVCLFVRNSQDQPVVLRASSEIRP